ncbi:MAG: MCE family protein [Bacteroidia bacterium]|nr:MCE family protein [Bacteroidia bacterium]MBT8269462.1 MCE family protein [Bacteroidia bacterium]NNF81697.1 MCE family protein [Flavobacteriaceae bacterium]NNK69669.1 MCE family protein [Flavobacteriaceae bacterium]NNL79853.1 MCE family protein [Flavobacteriaceae bacterium]
MERSSGHKIRLGIFVILGTIIFVSAIYLIGQRQEMFRKTYLIEAYFQNINGLQKGNNVRYSGIDIGTINDIVMVNDTSIRVIMRIDEKIISHLKTNAIATIGSDGLVGNMILNIVPGKGDARMIQDGDTIETFSKIGADDILSTLGASSENAAILTSDLLKITDAMINGEGTLALFLNDTTMSKDIKKSVNNLKNASYSATRSLNELNNIISNFTTNQNSVLGVLLNDSISGQKLKSVAVNLEKSSTEIDTMLSRINKVVSDIETGEGAINYLVHDTTLVYSLRQTIENVNEGTAKFNENMDALKNNFLLRGYFKKQERQLKKEERKANKDKE